MTVHHGFVHLGATNSTVEQRYCTRSRSPTSASLAQPQLLSRARPLFENLNALLKLGKASIGLRE
jgi:succinylarginine dihydrolase